MSRIVPSLYGLVLVVVLASVAAAQSEMKHPKSAWEGYYKSASVGDFVEYVNADGKPNNRKEITAVGDHRVSVTYTVYLDEKLKNEFQQVWVFSEPDPSIPQLDDVKTSREKVTIDGRELDCEKKDFYSKFGPKKDKPSRTEWRSKQVPFDGLVKQQQIGTITLTKMKYAKPPKE